MALLFKKIFEFFNAIGLIHKNRKEIIIFDQILYL